MATQILIDLFGEVALLMWGIHMVHTGILRVFGSQLRLFLGRSLRNPLRAFLSGLGITTLLQSSTATALMLGAFAAGGIVDLAPSLAVMLGANVGTTLIVQALSFNITLVFPLLILVGVTAFRRSARARTRDLGRVGIGLGLMLLALHLILETVQPIEASRTLRTLLGDITSDPALNLLIAALFSLAAHSSVASMLFIMSLAGAGVLSPTITVAMVLGANLGSAINPVLEGNRDDPAQLRMPIGNLLNRLAGCALALPFLGDIQRAILSVDPDPGRLAAHFHLLFNLAMSVLFIGLLPALSRQLVKWLPAHTAQDEPSRPMYLDPAMLGRPTLALTNAAREVLRMADMLTLMLRNSQAVFREEDRNMVGQVRAMDNQLSQLHGAVQRYLAALSPYSLDQEKLHRVGELLHFAGVLQHISEMVDRNLMASANRLLKQQLTLSEDELSDIEEGLGRLLGHLHLAVTILMFGDASSAHQLLREKAGMREMEMNAAERQFKQIRAGHTGDLEASNLYLETLRVLKRIDSYLTGTAYPLLEQRGELPADRLAPS
ncbi:Na/Pi cotransporter family protein [Chromobacterium sp. CV08]|uniref:Na/Pi cotransporter family protein n=1 Tax=Chromobacterium sp. CV08 TaxID=3133274 RepID=UPI003DA8354F